MYSEKEIDFAILDVMLPDIDGFRISLTPIDFQFFGIYVNIKAKLFQLKNYLKMFGKKNI